MWHGLVPALRFARSWAAPPSGLRRSEVRLAVPGENAVVPGTLLSPGGSRPLPGWVVLHGLTRTGRSHPELVRFTDALASTGARVLIPEVAEWIDLQFAPERAQRIIRGAVEWMDRDPGTAEGGVALVGFSFGAPQALLAASDPVVAPRIRTVVGWGGHADVERTFRFSLTGEHEWEGRTYRQRPDPYARWVIAANVLPVVAAYRERAGVARALHDLAADAGNRQVVAWDPVFDPLKEKLRAGLTAEERPLFDLLAPPSDRTPDREGAEALVAELVPAARRELPLLEAPPLIRRLEVPVRLLHGRSDALIPFTETLRLEAELAPRCPRLETRIIGLFSHSRETAPAGPLARLWENVRFLGALRSIFRSA